MCRHGYRAVVILAVVFLYSGRSQAALPELPKPDYTVISTLDYRDSAAAQKEWTLGDAAALASVERLGNRNVLKLTCNFDGTKGWRALWDYVVPLDLTHCQGIQMQFYCPDMSPVSALTVFIHSGEGWYVIRPDYAEKDGWSTIVIDKSHTGYDHAGTTGWHKIDRVRMSPVRGMDKNADLYFANLGLLGPDPHIAVVRVENLKKGASKWYARRALTISGCLNTLGLQHTLLSEADVRNGFLKDVELAIIPVAYGLPDDTTDNVVKFVKQGGKLVSFTPLRSKLKQASKGFAGVRTADFPEGSDAANELMALIGPLTPSLWRESAEFRHGRIGKLGPYGDYDEARRGMRSAARGNREVRALLRRAKGRRTEAKQLCEAKKYEEAVFAAAEAHDLMMEAHCTLQEPLEGEFRGFWSHQSFGLKGMTWDEAIKVLADNGFTAFFPNMQWGATTAGRSDVLTVLPKALEEGDQIAACLAACKKYGVECHIWRINWKMYWRAPKEIAERMEKEGRSQVTFSGEVKSGWLCPSHPENQKQEIEAMVELGTRYDLDGIHFDYIRYPDKNTCFCAGCHERFEKAIGRKVDNWPADVRSDPELQEEWYEFRRNNITRVVAAVSERVRKAKLKVKISAAVFRNWPDARVSVAQDWKLWCDKGYVDFVCPMDYTPSCKEFESAARLQAAWAGKVPYYPGIGAGLWVPETVDRLIEQIKITRRLKTGGFMVWQYREKEARHIVPLCGKGITRKR